jgi:hypothetical protein
MTKKEAIIEYIESTSNPSYTDYKNSVRVDLRPSAAYFWNVKNAYYSSNRSVSFPSLFELSNTTSAFNKIYFNNELDLSKVEVKWSSRISSTKFGSTVHKKATGNCIVSLNPAIHDVEKEWKNTLLHELVHVWQVQNSTKMNHSETFKNKSREIFEIDGKYKIEIKGSYDMMVKMSFTQYAIFRGENSINFMKNLSLSDIQFLKAHGIKVYRNTGKLLNVRHNKNIGSFMVSKYCYPADLIDLKNNFVSC